MNVSRIKIRLDMSRHSSQKKDMSRHKSSSIAVPKGTMAQLLHHPCTKKDGYPCAEINGWTSSLVLRSKYNLEDRSRTNSLSFQSIPTAACVVLQAVDDKIYSKVETHGYVVSL